MVSFPPQTSAALLVYYYYKSFGKNVKRIWSKSLSLLLGEDLLQDGFLDNGRTSCYNEENVRFSSMALPSCIGERKKYVSLRLREYSDGHEERLPLLER
jgi:hypothetical protein